MKLTLKITKEADGVFSHLDSEGHFFAGNDIKISCTKKQVKFTYDNPSRKESTYEVNNITLISEGVTTNFTDTVDFIKKLKVEGYTGNLDLGDIKPTAGEVVKHVKDVTPISVSDFYNFQLASGDFINFGRSSNGQQFSELSMNPLSQGDEQTLVEYKKPFRFPFFSEFEASMSLRPKGQYGVIEVTDKNTSYLDAPIEHTLTSVSQSTTTLTVVLATAFDGYLGSWVDIYGLVDNRFNYTNLCVASISSDKKTLTFGFSDEATLPSFTATPASLTGGKLKRQAKLLLAGNALGMRFSGQSATSCVYFSRFEGGSIKESGILVGSKLATCGNTAVSYISGAMGQVEIKSQNKYRIDFDADTILFGDRVVDSPSGLLTRSTFTAVKPIGDTDYYVRFRAVTPKSISRPIAKIVSATKASASTTATIVTDVPHGLTTTSYVTLKGIANQTVFANTTTATLVSSIINANTFTIVIGTATIATSYGGAVILCNGQVDQQGIVSQVVQSIARNADGIVTVVGSGTWSGVGGVGEYVNLHGVRSTVNGSDLGFDGVYKVHNFSTTTLLLEPVKNIAGEFMINGLGEQITPTGDVVTTTNAGGAVILRTTLRSHDIVLATYTQQIGKIAGQGTTRYDMALPVIVLNSVNTT